MSEAIDLLMREHRLIERVLDGLDGFAVQIGTDAPAPSDLADFADFAREFADGKHHAKEEGILFEAMVASGFPGDAGPIAVMLHEHESFRRLTAMLSELATVEGAWTGEQKRTIVSAIGEYSGTLRMHIQKEDQILYPMAERMLSPERMQDVTERCRAVDAADEAAGRAERWLSVAERLIDAYARP
jgi:hemerythrin-like domain-containing protein